VSNGYVVGLSLGEPGEHSAVAVVRAGRARDAALYDVVHLERYDRGTPYPAVAAAVRARLERPELEWTEEVGGWAVLRHGGSVGSTPRRTQVRRGALVVDYTGVGRPVLALLRAAGLEHIPVTLHGGDAVTYDGCTARVPKRDVIGAAQIVLQARRLRVAPALPVADVLAAELLSYRVRIGPDPAEHGYGAREGEHDDLLIAMAVAVWHAERPGAWPIKFDPGEWPTARRSW
jgi:hypothetical protein